MRDIIIGRGPAKNGGSGGGPNGPAAASCGGSGRGGN
jgi:hypothetical protein